MWQVSEAEGPIAAQRLLSVRVSGGAAVVPQRMRLAWHPASDDVIAFSAGRAVLLASVSAAGSSGDQVGMVLNVEIPDRYATEICSTSFCTRC